MLSGFIFLDTNDNGVRDDFEQHGLGDIPVVLTQIGGDVLSTTSTRPKGWYEFDNLTPGQSVVTIALPKGYFATTDVSVTLMLSPGEQGTVNFGVSKVGPVYLPLLVRGR